MAEEGVTCSKKETLTLIWQVAVLCCEMELTYGVTVAFTVHHGYEVRFTQLWWLRFKLITQVTWLDNGGLGYIQVCCLITVTAQLSCDLSNAFGYYFNG